MNCQDVEKSELAEKYLRGELDATTQDNFEVHILECPNCLYLAETLQAAREGLSLRAQEIRALAVPVEKPWPRLALAGGLAAVCLLAAGYFGWSRWHHRKTAGVKTPASSVAASHYPPAGKAADANAAKAPVATNKAAQPQTSAGVKTPAPLEKAAPNAAPSPAPREKSGSLGTFVPGAAAKAEEQRDVAEAALSKLEVVQKPAYLWPGPTTQPPKAVLGDVSAPAGTVGSGSEAGRTDFQQAMVAYLDGRYRVAIALLEDDLRKEPSAPDTNFYLGACYMLMGRPADSVAPLKVAAQNVNSPLRQSAHFYLAKAYLQTRELAEAENEYQAAAALAGPLKQDAVAELAKLRTIRATL
jgi:tetratricopeptide (TPR) repeat protein